MPTASARQSDINDFIEISGNPISKVGVFQYSGAQISADLDPNKIYNVYRPAEELNNEETIASFRLLPWTDEHAMLGSEDEGLMPAERKGVHGVIGETVYFEEPYLKANLKVFSEGLAKLIQDGKRELSIGYRCLYELRSGVYDGQQYDAIQRDIRGNHLALVEEGRSGSDVAVLDHFKITLDSKGLTMPKMKDEDTMKKDGETCKDDNERQIPTIESLSERIDQLMEIVGGLQSGEGRNKVLDDGEPEKFVKREDNIDESAEAAAKKEEKESEAGDESEEEKKDKDEDKKDSMDARFRKMSQTLDSLRENATKEVLKEVSQRNALVEKLSQHIGTFDHADKTLGEVVSYGVKALKLQCERGQEAAMLNGFLAGAKVNSRPAYAHDSVEIESNDQIEEFLNGSA